MWCFSCMKTYWFKNRDYTSQPSTKICSKILFIDISHILMLPLMSVFPLFVPGACMHFGKFQNTFFSPQWCASIDQPPTSRRGPAEMLSECDNKPGVMDGSQASTFDIRQATLVGRVIQRHALLSKRWVTTFTENHQDHSSLPHPLRPKTVHFLSYR